MKTSKLLCVVLFLCALIGCTEKESTVSVSSVSLNTATVEMVEGETFSLVATVLPKDAEYDGVIWASSNASVARVNSGTVTALKEGTATITASAGGKSSTCTVKVSTKVVSVTSITLDKTSLSMKVGETETITATVNPDNASDKSVVWGSSDVSIATVSDGKVTAKKSGTAIITAKSGSCIAECTITVSVDVESFTLDKTSLSLAVGETAQLTATVKPDNATDKNVTWTSSDESVAKVDNGYVVAVKEGEAIISASVGSVSASCKVVVINTNRVIKYTAESVVTPFNQDAFGAKIISNEYSYPNGMIIFDGPVVEIGRNAFFKCQTLKTIVIPESVSAIGGYAFYECTSLVSVDIQGGVSSLPLLCFGECPLLSTVRLPNTINKINDSVFDGCPALSNLYIKANIPPEIRNVYYVGWPTKNMSIWVPRASVDAYKEKWVQLKDNIKAYDF